MSGPARWVAFGAGCLAAGAVGGLVWRATTELPTWTVTPEGTAVLADQALVRMFEATARFVQVGAVAGLLLGLLALVLLRRRGWRVVAAAIVGPLLAGALAWGAGVLGGTPAEDLLAGAAVGSTVPVDLALGAPVALLVWPFLAMVPVLFWSAFAADPDSHRTRPSQVSTPS